MTFAELRYHVASFFLFRVLAPLIRGKRLISLMRSALPNGLIVSTSLHMPPPRTIDAGTGPYRYETMVFRRGRSRYIYGDDIDVLRTMTEHEAVAAHRALCRKWLRRTISSVHPTLH